MSGLREFCLELIPIHGSKMMRIHTGLQRHRGNILPQLRIKSALAILVNHYAAVWITHARVRVASIYISAQRRRYFIILQPKVLRTFRHMVK